MKCKIIGIIELNDNTVGYKILDMNGNCVDIDLETAKVYIANGIITNALLSNGNIRISTFDTSKLPRFTPDGRGSYENSIVVLYALECGLVHIGFNILLPLGNIKTISMESAVDLRKRGISFLNAGLHNNKLVATQGKFITKQVVYEKVNGVMTPKVISNEEYTNIRKERLSYDAKFKVTPQGKLLSITSDVLKAEKISIPDTVKIIDSGILNKAQCKVLVIPSSVSKIYFDNNTFNFNKLRKVYAREHWSYLFSSDNIEFIPTETDDLPW